MLRSDGPDPFLIVLCVPRDIVLRNLSCLVDRQSESQGMKTNICGGRRRIATKIKRLGLCVSALLTITLVAACDGPADREAKFMRRAEQYLAERRPDKAMLEL